MPNTPARGDDGGLGFGLREEDAVEKGSPARFIGVESVHVDCATLSNCGDGLYVLRRFVVGIVGVIVVVDGDVDDGLWRGVVRCGEVGEVLVDVVGVIVTACTHDSYRLVRGASGGEVIQARNIRDGVGDGVDG